MASQLEKAGLRRVPAVAAVSVLFIAVAVTLAWVLGHQVIDVAALVPEYRENIDRKLESVRSIGDGKLKGFVDSIDGLQQEIFANSPQPGAATENGEKPLSAVSKASRRPIIVQTQPSSPLVTRILGPVIRPVSETGIVLVLLLFMLVRRSQQDLLTSWERSLNHNHAGAPLHRNSLPDLLGRAVGSLALRPLYRSHNRYCLAHGACPCLMAPRQGLPRILCSPAC